jgi:hypothetical protein
MGQIEKGNYMGADVQAKDLEITLIPSPDDPSLESEHYQAVIRDFDSAFRAHGLIPSSRVLLMESAGNEVAPHLGVFAVNLKDALPVIGSVLTGWFAGRFGRKVRVRVGDIEVETNTVADAEKLIAKAQELKRSKTPKKDQ